MLLWWLNGGRGVRTSVGRGGLVVVSTLTLIVDLAKYKGAGGLSRCSVAKVDFVRCASVSAMYRSRRLVATKDGLLSSRRSGLLLSCMMSDTVRLSARLKSCSRLIFAGPG